MQLLTDSDIVPAEPAARRLHGTVWQDVSLAHHAYGAMHRLGLSLGKLGVSANLLTLLALVITALSGMCVASGELGVAAALVVVGGVFDALDGVVARSTGTSSAFGALLDSTVDRFSDAFPLVGVAMLYLDHEQWVLVPLLALLMSFGVSYVRARAEALGARMPSLFMRRAERTVLLVVCLALGTLDVPAPVPHVLLLVGVGLLGALSAAGVLVALHSARRALGGTDKD